MDVDVVQIFKQNFHNSQIHHVKCEWAGQLSVALVLAIYAVYFSHPRHVIRKDDAC